MAKLPTQATADMPNRLKLETICAESEGHIRHAGAVSKNGNHKTLCDEGFRQSQLCRRRGLAWQHPTAQRERQGFQLQRRIP